VPYGSVVFFSIKATRGHPFLLTLLLALLVSQYRKYSLVILWQRT
jgi:hypothetical protein